MYFSDLGTFKQLVCTMYVLMHQVTAIAASDMQLSINSTTFIITILESV